MTQITTEINPILNYDIVI